MKVLIEHCISELVRNWTGVLSVMSSFNELKKGDKHSLCLSEEFVLYFRTKPQPLLLQ